MQLLLGAITRVMGTVRLVSLAAAVIAPLPGQVVCGLGAAALTKPAGYASTKGASSVAVTLAGLDSVRRKVVVCPVPIALGTKLLTTEVFCAAAT